MGKVKDTVSEFMMQFGKVQNDPILYNDLEGETIAVDAEDILREFCDFLEQRPETGQVDAIVIAPKWETPDEFGLYEIFNDWSFQFLHDILFWAFIPTNTKNEIHLCGVDESGLYGYNLDIDDRYDTGWSLDDVQYCMRYEQTGQ